MSKALNRTLRLVSLAAIAASVAACEPDEEVRRNLSPFSLAESEGPFDLSLQDAGMGGGIGDLLPAALPLLADGGGNYGLAPSWDYARGDYVDYAPGDPYDYYGYDEPYGGYYDEAGYYGDAGYYDQSTGSHDFMWPALAALIASVIGDSPPDYGFDHYGVQPWAWRTGDGYYRLVEPIYGGNRYYYYAPGAGQPFLVRDPYFSYGYRDDRLVALYDRDGRVMDERAARRQRKAAQQYLARAETLYRAARADSRTGVAVRDWEQRLPVLAGDQRRWRQAKAEQAAWRQWDKQYERGLRERWRRESAAREQAARRVESWRETSYRGPAPRLYARERTADVQRVAIVQPRHGARGAKAEPRPAFVQRREAKRDTAHSQLALADGRQQEIARERNLVREARIAAAGQTRRHDLVVPRPVRTDKARGERQQRVAQQDRARPQRQAAAEQQRAAKPERVRFERQASAERRERAVQQERVKAERQASAERQERAARERRERARAERQAAQRQQQVQAGQVAQQQRAAQQERAKVERQASAERQQRAARERQERAQAERQVAQRQQQVQAQQVAQQQQQRAAREQQERARAERQASAERQQRAQHERARAEQQAARRQQQEQARQIAQQQRQRQQQQQAREAQRAAQQAAAAARPAATSRDERGGGRKNGRG
jgi:hypothetical protein